MFSEDILKHTLETTQIGYWDCDIQNNRKYLSPQFRAMFGYDEYEPDTMSIWSEALHPDDHQRVNLTYEHHIVSRGAHPFRVKTRYYHRNGSLMWMKCQGSVVAWDKEGRPLRMVGSHVDITKEQQATEALQRYQNALTALNRIATNNQLNAEQQINAALKAVSSYLELPLGIVSQIRDDEYEITNISTTGTLALEAGQKFTLGETYCSITFQADQAVGFHHVSETKWVTHPCYQTMGLETYIGAPVKVRGERYGTVNFSSPTPRNHLFSPYDLEFIALLANWVGYVLEWRNTRYMLERMVREQTDTLEKRNRQLAEFAFLNAHKMRGPLARILGLVEVLPLTNSRAEEKECLQFIAQSAMELDAAIKNAASTLGAFNALNGFSKISDLLTPMGVEERTGG